MTMKQASEGYNGIYLERSGTSSRKLAEILVAQPEFPLDELEKQEVYEFEESLYNHELSDGLTVEGLIKSHKGEAVTAPRFFADAFLNHAVDISSLSVEVPVFSSPDSVYSWLATNANNGTIDAPTFRQIAKQSSDYYIKIVADSLVNEQIPDSSALDNMPIVINPTDTVKFAADALEIRELLTDLRKQYKEGGDKVDGAKRAFIDVYLGKINNLVAGDITTINYLINQAKLIDDKETQTVAEGLIPSGLRSALTSPDTQKTLFKRLDYLQNGIGLDQNGRATTVEQVVIDENEDSVQESLTEKPLFTLEQRETLKTFQISPEQMKEIFSNVLKKAGLFSSESPSTWSPTRSQRAADKLFQVVTNPKKNTFAVDGISGAYQVPAQARSLYDVMVIGGFHELEHINQVQTDLEIAKTVRIAAVKGRRVSMFREGGANYKQRQAEKALFGDSKPIALTYARALQSLEVGGNSFDASWAFYNEKRRIMPHTSPEDAAHEAADRVLRLTIHGGINSQSMAYAEENILNQELKDATQEVKDRAIVITSLDLVDQVRLHKYDLLPSLENEEVDWTSLILKELELYINQALTK